MFDPNREGEIARHTRELSEAQTRLTALTKIVEEKLSPIMSAPVPVFRKRVPRTSTPAGAAIARASTDLTNEVVALEALVARIEL